MTAEGKRQKSAMGMDVTDPSYRNGLACYIQTYLDEEVLDEPR